MHIDFLCLGLVFREKKRSLIEVISEVNQISFTLQPMVMKYLLTERRPATIPPLPGSVR